ncbi:unnamed protein product [Allacma fusca]|uniref:EF-hand domain-containing protein n=1 Tax=Allacma fusca TaxID=39272 RepID=A0A8J2J1V3_9HEXA|nr:unnamed protein product [Allacma fusca]
MGNVLAFIKHKSTLTEEMYYDYSKLTFLNMAEVHELHYLWRNCAPEVIDDDPMARLPYKAILKIEQFKCNPFADRIIQHFSPYKDGSMNFDDFINMYSLLGAAETGEFRIFLVFQIFDDDEDGYLNCSDCIKIVKRLLKNDYLQNLELIIVLQWLLREADIDGDGRISFDEFSHMMHKSVFFTRTWRLI